MATHADYYQHHHHTLPPPPDHRNQPEYQHPYGVAQDQPEPQSHHFPQIQQRQPQHQHQQQQPLPSPSAKRRTFSFHSEHSQKSSGNHNKPELIETHAEKESKRLHSKADPTLAMSEAEPAMVAAMKTESSIAPLRSLQHKDNYGNVIAEPDKSNPTRHRWERPLDTIRSFEAAIDGGYARKSMYRSDTDSVVQFNRRSSFHPGQQQQSYQDHHYGKRPVSMRQDSQQFNPRHSYYEGQGHNGGYGPPPNGRHRASRQYSEPQFHNARGQNVYPLPHKDRSYETVTSAAGSGSEHAGYQTDPTSSDNSSIERERASPPKRLEPINDYGIAFNQTQNSQAHNFSVVLPAQTNNPLPPVPQGANQYGGPQPVQRKTLRREPSEAKSTAPTAEKRKSWFSRRFSRQG